MSDKKTLRTEPGERIDQPDFQHAVEQAELFDGVHGAAVLVQDDSYIIDGFVPSGTGGASGVTVTRDTNGRSGEAVLAYSGRAGVTYGHVLAGGDAIRTLDIAGLADGDYRLYISFEWRDADIENRTFWNPDTASGGPLEIVEAIPSRRQANWTLTVAADGVSPGPEWLQIARFSVLSGVLDGAVVDTRPLYFEGYVNDPGFFGLITSYDPEEDAFSSAGDRDPDRATNGFHNLRKTIRALQSQIRDLNRAVSSTAGSERWWDQVSAAFLLARDGSRTITGNLVPDLTGNLRTLGNSGARFRFGYIDQWVGDLLKALTGSDLLVQTDAGQTITLDTDEVILDTDKLSFASGAGNAPSPITDTEPTLYRNTVPIAWGHFETDGAGNFTNDATVGCSLSFSGGNARVTFDPAVAPATSADYAVVATGEIAIIAEASGRTAARFDLSKITPGSGTIVDISANASGNVSFVVFGTRS